MVVSRRDDAISEVIGFVLILALIAIIASLYLTYVVPAQGRDLEIAHMDVVQNQFLDYKSTVDSLWINGQYNTQVSSPFTLGTNPGSTQGSFVNMPLFQPVTSGGTMVVNESNELIAVTADALFTQGSDSQKVTPDIQFVPEHLYVNFSTSDITKTGSIWIIPSNGNWEAQLNTTSGSPASLSITILKNGIPTVNNLVIQNSIISNQFYRVDLTDSEYGLKDSFVYPFGLTFSPPIGPVTCQQTVYYSNPAGGIFNRGMGSLEYRSDNNYWITQNYIYEYGGVFLQQDNNGSVVKLLPSITITNDSQNQNLVHVTIQGIIIHGTAPSRVGGSSLVQVLTALQPDITTNNLADPQTTGIPNAKTVIIKVTAEDSQTADMWYQTLLEIQQQSNAKDSISVTKPVGNSVTMTIFRSSMYDIILDTQSYVANVYLSPTSY